MYTRFRTSEQTLIYLPLEQTPAHAFGSISMNITRAEAWQLHKAVNTAKGDLCRHRDRNPTGGA